MIGTGPGLAYFVRLEAAVESSTGRPIGLLLTLTSASIPSGTSIGLLLSLTLTRPCTPMGLLLALTKET